MIEKRSAESEPIQTPKKKADKEGLGMSVPLTFFLEPTL
jgi:hypothetical protein